MPWVLLVAVLLVGAAVAIGLCARSLYVRGRRLAAELSATSQAIQISLDAVDSSRYVADPPPPGGPVPGGPVVR